MPKKLILCRHAEAGFMPPGSTDFERPLTERGIKQAQQVNNWLLQRQNIPGQVICSAAVRALSTARLAVGFVPTDKIISDKNLYEASPTQLLQKINNTHDSVNTLMFVGHNPTISQLAWQLSGSNFDLLPAQLVVLECEIDTWKMLTEDIARVAETFTPNGNDI